jgi:hypothetical protein
VGAKLGGLVVTRKSSQSPHRRGVANGDARGTQDLATSRTMKKPSPPPPANRCLFLRDLCVLVVNFSDPNYSSAADYPHKTAEAIDFIVLDVGNPGFRGRRRWQRPSGLGSASIHG